MPQQSLEIELKAQCEPFDVHSFFIVYNGLTRKMMYALDALGFFVVVDPHIVQPGNKVHCDL